MCEGPLETLLQAEEEAYEGNIHAAQALLVEADTQTQGFSFPGYAKQRRKVLELIAAQP